MKAITADSSSRYAIFTLSNGTLCLKNLLCAQWALSIMKYLSPETPPHPKLVKASINYRIDRVFFREKKTGVELWYVLTKKNPDEKTTRESYFHPNPKNL